MLNIKNVTFSIVKIKIKLITFLGLIACNSKKLERGQLSSVSKQFMEFFTVALTYRTKQIPSEQVILNFYNLSGRRFSTCDPYQTNQSVF